MADAAAHYLGIDIGGTKVAAGLVSASGRIVQRERRPMLATGSAEAALEAVVEAALAVSGDRTITAAGVSCPGPLDPRRGVVLNPPNLPCWRNFALAAKLGRRLGLPVKLDNDANAAALAEARWGSGRGYGAVFYATLGTGIGAGLVLEGKIYHGRTGAAVEGGHLSINHRGVRCACGKRGCIEALAAGPA
ncbi:MAG: ROK family protein, partial [Terriglobales bacterium]